MGSLLSAASLAATALPSAAAAEETCRYAGSTSYDGRLTITSDVRSKGGSVRVDIRVSLEAQPLPLFHTSYLMEEISTADGNGLERLAVNSRYSVDRRIVRQGWDVFDRVPGGLQAHRIEGKHAAEFARQHPSFARYWPVGMFGRPWVDDFELASPERRPDLDLRDTSPAVRPPLALALYWLPALPPGEVVVPVFLPGFKDQKRVDLAIGKSVASADAKLRQARLRYPELDPNVPSTASAWLSADGRVMRLFFDLHGREYSARATIDRLGCDGTG